MWQPELVESPETVAKLAALYTSASRAFAVFRSGTIVFSDGRASRSDEDYIATLSDAISGAPNFNVQEMKQGAFLVRFRGPVTGVVISEFYEKHRESIRKHLDTGALLPGETVLAGTRASVPDEHYYVGLYARCKLFADAEEKLIVERFSPGNG
jgi:hypothetical protein